jgi:hypothetical protein
MSWGADRRPIFEGPDERGHELDPGEESLSQIKA